MEASFLFSPASFGALFVVVLCVSAAITTRIAALRLAAVPKLDYLREHIARKTAERDDLERKIDELRAELAIADKEKAELSVLRQEKEQLVLELADIEDKLANLANDRATIEQVQNELAAALDKHAQATQDLKDAEAKKVELDLALQAMERERAEAQGALTKAQNDLTELRSAEDEQRSKLTQAKDEYEVAERAAKRENELVEELQKKRFEGSVALEEVKLSAEKAKGEVAAAEGAIQRLTAEQRDMALRTEGMLAEQHGLTAELATLRVQAEGSQRDIKRANEELVAAAAALERDEIAATELRHRKDALSGELEMLKQVKANLEGKIGPKTKEEADQTLADLLKVPDGLRRATRRVDGLTEAGALDQVKMHLANQGFDFSERVINAFHTSLKISSISPLTVLAGISGTGKSELPRQYADAIGLPFFQLAVQPRWDSPQDLFGFYNYLEHRYKPTELVRVMIHLDTRHWPKQAEEYKDHMALVLLDEMNLARVEYYFSEFLSRLEVRRDKEDEPAAEIELELGHLPEGRSNKLYPMPRLLFVGTMNEDESTQTLSDKVVDRANVLRFSRPKSLVSSKAVKPGAGEVGHDRMLPFSVWKSWQKRTPASGDSKLDGWLTTLNGHMEMLGRPFGHRMGQAIRDYVVNHPRSASGVDTEAMADQLEMRLFPKLRGIEPDFGDHPAALDGIRKFIENELRDVKLAEAFEVARRNDLFLWRGMHRDL